MCKSFHTILICKNSTLGTSMTLACVNCKNRC